ncbi:MAG: hypothetical protein MZV64_71145 [Ignavibacteriales bacterium]|nr:hypothetical protein [Ignavibacteriales bacterium]
MPSRSARSSSLSTGTRWKNPTAKGLTVTAPRLSSSARDAMIDELKSYRMPMRSA